ncbi:MAG: type II toxin-antitoxin system RelE/ParE family toxin [Dongiaceae bacterium]
MSFQFHPESEAEYLEAIAYYEKRRASLGASYMAEFEHAVARICQAPDRYPVERQPDVRRAGLRRFPFSVLYREVGGVVQVLAVAHHRRRPS